MKCRKIKDYYPKFTVKRFNLLFHVIFLVLKLFNRIYMREIKMLIRGKEQEHLDKSASMAPLCG